MSTVRRTMPALAVAALCLVIGVLLGRVCADADSGTGAAALTDSDIAFAQEMSMHHQQAIGMTDMLGPGAAPDVRALATQIRSSQWREIGILTGWLELAGAPFQPAAHTDPGRHDMPGTASNEELTRLHDAAGPEQETLFLQLMIRHHQGGIDMAAEAARATALPAVRARATAIVDEQQQEITLMTVSMDARGASALPYP